MPEAWKRFCPMPSHRGEVKSYDDYQTGGAGDSLRNYKQAAEMHFLRWHLPENQCGKIFAD